MTRLDFITDAVQRQLRLSPTLTRLGLLGMGLAGVCVLAMPLGIQIPPEGNLIETATFDAALGFFLMTLAVLSPGVSWSERGKKLWVGALVGNRSAA